jgi:hypothetical protein
MLIEAGQAKGVRYQGRARYVRAGNYAVGNLLGIEGFAVQEQLRVEFSRAQLVST